MARASTWTLLALDRYAQIMGAAPAHFNQGISGTVFPLSGSCSDVWFQWAWQRDDAVSREDLAMEIAEAEKELADYLGWWMAPVWTAQEAHMYPRHHRPDVYSIGGYNLRGQGKSVRTQYGKVIEPGQRDVTLIGTVTTGGGGLAYTDADGDGFSETATVTIATTLTDACALHVYFAGELGAPEWEIRPARTKTIAGGVFTATFWAWQFIDPDLWDEIPTINFAAIDLDAAASYVVSADVYYEFNDPTATSSTFYWEPSTPTIFGAICSSCGGTGCACCTLTTQDGCFHIRDAESGIVVPRPGTYSSDDAAWSCDSWSVCRDPEQVKLYYYSGDLSNENRRGIACEQLSNFWAQTIAYMATARLERTFCACGNLQALAVHLREDLALAGSTSYQVSPDYLDNPFGTRRGEVMAWQRVSRLVKRKTGGVAAI